MSCSLEVDHSVITVLCGLSVACSTQFSLEYFAFCTSSAVVCIASLSISYTYEADRRSAFDLTIRFATRQFLDEDPTASTLLSFES